MKSCILKRCLIKHLRLRRIHLIKGQWWNLILNIPNIIRNITLPPQQLNLLTHNHIGTFRITTGSDASHPRYLTQKVNQRLFLRNPCPIDHQADHHLFRNKPIPNQHMTNQAFPGLLIIGRDAMSFHPSQHPIQYLLVLFHAQITLTVIDNTMGSPRIKSRNQFAVLIRPHGKLSLIPVIEWLFHPQNRLHRYLLKTADPL